MTRNNRKKIVDSLSHFSAGSNVDTYIGGLTADGEEAGRIIQVPLRELGGAAWQPRVLDDADSMKHLMESIARDGVLHPLTVRNLPLVRGAAHVHRYEVVAGHRRLDAMRRLACAAGTADTATAPVIIRDLTDLEARLLTHAENAARKNLEAWEKAREIASVRDALAAAGAPHDVDSVGAKVVRSGGGVSEYLRIADLITVDALIAAGACDADGALDATVVRAMTRAQLFAVVKKGDQARPGALRALVARTRSAPSGRHQRVGGSGGSPDTSQADRPAVFGASPARERWIPDEPLPAVRPIQRGRSPSVPCDAGPGGDCPARAAGRYRCGQPHPRGLRFPPVRPSTGRRRIGAGAPRRGAQRAWRGERQRR